MIDAKFRNINRLFVQSFKIDENDPTRNVFLKYYMSLIEKILMRYFTINHF